MWIRWWCWRGGGSRPYCYRKIGNINHELFWCFGLFSPLLWGSGGKDVICVGDDLAVWVIVCHGCDGGDW